MEKLSTVQGEVRLILESKPESRDSDEILYYIYLSRHGITTPSISYFLLHFNEYGVSDFESVSRARRKIQERCPELRASEKVQELREGRQMEFLEAYGGGIGRG